MGNPGPRGLGRLGSKMGSCVSGGKAGGGGGASNGAPWLANSGSIVNDDMVVLSADERGVSWDGLINAG